MFFIRAAFYLIAVSFLVPHAKAGIEPLQPALITKTDENAFSLEKIEAAIHVNLAERIAVARREISANRSENSFF